MRTLSTAAVLCLLVSPAFAQPKTYEIHAVRFAGPFTAPLSEVAVGGAPRSGSCDELRTLITQHLRIAKAILYVALAGALAAMRLP